MRAIGAVLLLLPMLAGCGFQPRGVGGFPAEIQPVRVVGLPEFDDFRRAVESQLREAGAQLTEEGEAAASTLHLAPVKPERRVLSVSALNKTLEYEIGETVKFSLTGTEGRVLVAEQRLHAERILLNPGNQSLGRSTEEDLLRLDMHRELATRLIRLIDRQAR